CLGNNYNFSEITNELKAQYPDEDFIVTYFDSLSNANINHNPLPLNYQPDQSKTIYVRVTNAQVSECFSISSFAVAVYQYPEVTGIDEVYGLCPGEFINISISPNFDSYQWSDGSTSNVINISEGG